MYAAQGYLSHNHCHFAATVLIALDGGFELRIGGSRLSKRWPVVVAPNQTFAIEAPATRILILNLDPNSSDYAPLAQMLGNQTHAGVAFDPLRDCRETLEALFSGVLACKDANQLYYEILDRCHHRVSRSASPGIAIDPRVKHVLGELRTNETIIQASSLASFVSLSEDRLMRLFRKETGMTIRSYSLWVRLQRAMSRLQAGDSLTHIALDAGFYDLPHLARTVKRMYGVRSASFNDARFVQLHRCGLWEGSYSDKSMPFGFMRPKRSGVHAYCRGRG